MIAKRAVVCASLILSLGLGTGPARADGLEEAKDGAQRLWDLLGKKFQDEKNGEAWLNRKFPNKKWLDRIVERENEPRPEPVPPSSADTLPTEGLVTEVTDGDTLTIEGIGAVRLQGVDTSEKLHPTKPVQYLSAEASQFTRGLALNQRVRVEYGSETRDKYGRVLAFVYLPDGRMLNAEIIKAGFGYAYTRYPFKYEADFVKFEERARAQNLGLWADNGLGEYNWLRSQNRESFDVFEMSENLWGVRWADMVLLRLTTDQLRLELEYLRKDVHALGPKDLEKELSARGYLKAPQGAS